MRSRARWTTIAWLLIGGVGVWALAVRGRPHALERSAVGSVAVLTTPTSEYASPFTRLEAARELRNGRVLTLDVQDRALGLLDFDSGASAPVGRVGSGPNEYLSPRAVLPWRGDTTFVVDATKYYSVLVISPNGEPSGTYRTSDERLGRGDRFRVLTDTLGHFYAQVPWYRKVDGRFGPHPDSALIVRLTMSTGALDTLLWINIVPRLPNQGDVTRDAGTASRPYLRTSPPFAVRDQWVVTLDGRVGVVSVDPYQVSFLNADGSRTVGPVLPTSPVPVREADKEWWRDQKRRPVSITVFSGGEVSAQLQSLKFDEPDAWPKLLPPFGDQSVHISPDGTLWIQRLVAAGTAPVVDVIGSSGAPVQHVQLPLATRIVGLSLRSVYLVRVDDDDLEFLQRYRRP